MIHLFIIQIYTFLDQVKVTTMKMFGNRKKKKKKGELKNVKSTLLKRLMVYITTEAKLQFASLYIKIDVPI